MPEVRYSIPGVPPDPARGITAFAPHFNRPAASGAQDYKYAVRGYPGTKAIPVDAREDNIEGHYTGLAMAGGARTSDAPDAFWPNQYYQDRAVEEPGGNIPQPRVYSPQFPGRTTLIPVPAEDGRAAYLAQSARLAQQQSQRGQMEVPVYPRVYQTARWGR